MIREMAKFITTKGNRMQVVPLSVWKICDCPVEPGVVQVWHGPLVYEGAIFFEVHDTIEGVRAKLQAIGCDQTATDNWGGLL